MTATDAPRADWRKSSRSNGGDDSCVEVVSLTVEDSERTSGPYAT